MKKITNTVLAVAMLILTATGCQKSQDIAPETESVGSQSVGETVISSEEGVATATTSTANGNIKLTLRPAKDSGQDAMILRYDPDPTYVNMNKGHEVDIPALTWTAGGIPTYRRDLIKFTQLSLIPANSTIVSATLYLYGLPAGGSPNCPQGNSFHPNTPPSYQNNKSFLQMCAATPMWNQNTVTWATQPGTIGNQVLIPATSQQWSENKVVNITNFVQSWVNGTPNNGMLMSLLSETPYRSITFGTSENTVNYRPKLVVVYF